MRMMCIGLAAASITITGMLVTTSPARGADVVVVATASLQEAIDSARDGDTLLLEAGRWNESLDLRARRLTLRATGAEATVRACGGRALHLTSGADITLEGLTIEGEVMVEQASLNAVNCVLGGRECDAALRGADADVRLSGVDIDGQPVGVTILNEEAPERRIILEGVILANCQDALTIRSAGRVHVSDTTIIGPGVPGATGIDVRAADVTLRRVAISAVDGGAIRASGGRVTLTGVTVMGCGGAATPAPTHVRDVGLLELEGCWLSDNEGRLAGGLLAEGVRRGVRVEGCTFVGNTGHGLAEGSAGGAAVWMHGDGGRVTLRGNRWVDNHSAGLGAGALAVRGATGVTLQGEDFQLNGALAGAGGVSLATARADVSRTMFHDNHTNADGGALHLAGAGSIGNCVFSDNRAGGRGGALLLTGDLALQANLVVRHCTIVSNHAAPSREDAAAGATLHATDIFPRVINSIIYGNRAGAEARATALRVETTAPAPNREATVSHCIIEGGWSGAGEANLDVDPRFRADARGALHLLPGSAAVDAGHPDVRDSDQGDFTGGTRVLGAGPDLGAFELCLADLDLDGRVTYEDLDALVAAWGTASPVCDLDADGVVGQADLDLLMTQWAASCR